MIFANRTAHKTRPVMTKAWTGIAESSVCSTMLRLSFGVPGSVDEPHGSLTRTRKGRPLWNRSFLRSRCLVPRRFSARIIGRCRSSLWNLRRRLNRRVLRRSVIMSFRLFHSLSTKSDHFKQRLINVLEDVLSTRSERVRVWEGHNRLFHAVPGILQCALCGDLSGGCVNDNTGNRKLRGFHQVPFFVRPYVRVVTGVFSSVC